MTYLISRHTIPPTSTSAPLIHQQRAPVILFQLLAFVLQVIPRMPMSYTTTLALVSREAFESFDFHVFRKQVEDYGDVVISQLLSTIQPQRQLLHVSAD
jgi:hypothetical protein